MNEDMMKVAKVFLEEGDATEKTANLVRASLDEDKQRILTLSDVNAVIYTMLEMGFVIQCPTEWRI